MKKILIVDDDQRLCKMLRRTLVYEGYDVTTAEDGQEALEAVTQGAPFPNVPRELKDKHDAVLLSVERRDMDGCHVQVNPPKETILATGDQLIFIRRGTCLILVASAQ
mgnify:CR=1 FL=1